MLPAFIGLLGVILILFAVSTVSGPLTAFVAGVGLLVAGWRLESPEGNT